MGKGLEIFLSLHPDLHDTGHGNLIQLLFSDLKGKGTDTILF
jgi:hypothetical protein